MLETPTWRANPDWGERLGYDAGCARPGQPGRGRPARRPACRATATGPTSLVGGVVGPRGDGYVAGERTDPDEAADYHAPQVEAFAAAGADLVRRTR